MQQVSEKSYLSKNNFDLIRLFAALQVVVGHASEHLGAHIPKWHFFFPGVPIFFFISGFLISASWERDPEILNYAIKRGLRIYPALALVFLFSVITVFLFDPDAGKITVRDLALWAAAHLTLLQDWNPSFLRSYGVGAINGSLWTISVEITFYIAVPLIYAIMKMVRRAEGVLILFALVSFALLYAIGIFGLDARGDHVSHFTVGRILKATAAPWIGMFLCGMLAQKWIARIYPFVVGKFWIWLAAYLMLSFVAGLWPVPALLATGSNEVGFVNYLVLAGFIMSFAFSWPSLAGRLLHRNDISYGVYIFHMPVVNALLTLGVVGLPGFVATFVFTILFALLSWFLVEEPVLGLRKKALYVHTSR